MQALLGVLFHFIGGGASSSFYVPYKKVKGWSWESFWILGGFFSWLIVPFIAAWVTIPAFANIIGNTGNSTIGYTYLYGMLWGIGGLTYGLGVRYLGVSLGSSIILGLSMVIGALLPSIYYEIYPVEGKDSIGTFFGTNWGLTTLFGLALCLLGVFLCGKAGMQKEKDLGGHSDASGNSEFNLGIGLVVAIISGTLSACFNFGLEAGKPMAHEANELWKATHPGQGEFLFQNNVTYIVILWGGITTNLAYCAFLLWRNKSYTDYFNERTPRWRNFLLCALGGTMWYLQFFFYGMGESKLGNGASSWILHMAFIILLANLWGVILKEWKGVSRKTYLTVVAGIVVIIISVLIVGFAKELG